ncbi:MAG: toxin [Patescibacteria group bacterium]|nr:DUF4258 domain-containing protein [Patescibacteria group bacterium]
MKYFDWNEDKNEILSEERGVCFQDVVLAIEKGKLLDILKHKNQAKYPNQWVFVVDIGNYIYLVPFIEDEEKVFLKTVIPSRKATKEYLVKKKGK